MENEENNDFQGDVSHLKIEKYLAGDLNPKDTLEFESLLDSDPSLKTRVDSLNSQKIPFSFEELEKKMERGKKDPEGVMAKNSKRPNSRIIPLKMALALAASFVFAVLSIFQLSKNSDPDLHSSRSSSQESDNFMVKGSSGIFLALGSAPQKISSGSTISVKPGDTLSFIYRNSQNLFAQIWYRDDGGNLFAYLIDNNGSAMLEAAQAWVTHSTKVVLTSGWKREEVFILFHDADFSAKLGKEIIQGQTLPDIQIHKYFLVNSAPSEE